MVGSAAEERIRAKAEAYLRANYADARIIHELVLDQGGCRIDIAAVGIDYIAVVEVKSEKDVLTRLPDQVRAAVKVSNRVTICVAEKKAAGVKAMAEQYLDEKIVTRQGPNGEARSWHYAKNPVYVREIDRKCFVMVEQPDGELRGESMGYFRDWILNPQDLLAMLWADELRAVCYDLGVGPKSTRTNCIKLACDMLSGREVRRRVCRELRSRPFPRADAATRPPRDANPLPPEAMI